MRRVYQSKRLTLGCLQSPCNPLHSKFLTGSRLPLALNHVILFGYIRLVEFCLSLPSEQKLNDGWTRLVLRKALEGVVPPEIQWRRSKFDFTHHLSRGMLLDKRLIEDVIANDIDGVGEYANLPSVFAAYSRTNLWGRTGR